VTLELDRRLVAVMFTDMVRYTALIRADERLVTLAKALALATL
jgi:class 3 adenylate cyclase